MATIQQLESALVNAHKAGDSDAARKLAVAVKAARSDTANFIPGGVQVPGTTPAAPEPSLADRAIGTGEAALTLATGATGGTLGMIGGTLKGLAEQILSGNFGTPEAANLVERSAQQGAEALTYAPRTEQGQAQAAAAGDALANLVPVAAVAPGLAPASAGARAASPLRATAQAAVEGTVRDVAGQPAAAAAARGIDAAARVADLGAQKITTLPRRALEALRRDPDAPTPGTQASGGAAGTDRATQRRVLGESFGLTGDAAMTKGQASRDSAQLKFEVETAKMMEEGAPLRRRISNQNAVLDQQLMNAVDAVGGEAISWRSIGESIDKPLRRQFMEDSADVHKAYTAAHRSAEAKSIVDQSVPVTIGEGERAVTGTPLSFLNSQPTGVPSSGLADAARQYAVKRGIAEMKDGELVPRPATIRQLEEWRSDISQATGYEKPDIRTSTILKGMIDAQTEPVAGPIYRQARARRARLAQNYEDRASVAKLLAEKPGTRDRAVALEDVFDQTVLKGSLDDLRNVRRVLHRSKADGAQGWRELQGGTLQWVRQEAGLDNFVNSKNVSRDSTGNAVLSPAGLNRAIQRLDQDGKLDFIFGKQGAQRLRDLNEVAQDVRTVPPESAINTSNTAVTMTGFADVILSGLSGVPAPVTTATRLIAKSIRDKKLRRRITDALNEAERQRAPGQNNPARQLPGPETLH